MMLQANNGMYDGKFVSAKKEVVFNAVLNFLTGLGLPAV